MFEHYSVLQNVDQESDRVIPDQSTIVSSSCSKTDRKNSSGTNGIAHVGSRQNCSYEVSCLKKHRQLFEIIIKITEQSLILDSFIS